MFYVGCTYHGSSEMKCSVSGTARLMIAFENNVAPKLNPTLNLTDSVNKSQDIEATMPF